jgi:acyl dehydratase
MPNPIRQQAISGLKPGDTFSYRRRFSQSDTHRFGELTRDYNPVHYEPRWAEQKHFAGLICHGLLVGSMICEFGGQVGWLATGMQFNFIKPVYFGDTIRCEITLTKIEPNGRAEAEARFFNQDGLQVCRAHLTGRLPADRERELLKQMVEEGDPSNRLANQAYDPPHRPTIATESL